jgi:hypothetical protein
MAQREDDYRSEATFSASDAEGLIEAVNCQDPVRGLTHGHYRYPARFSPDFAQEVIKSFSRPGDVIFDPFMGGGTSAVEALSTGRRFVGTDTNSLAHFVTSAKTDVMDKRDEAALFSWILELPILRRVSSGETAEPQPQNVPASLRNAIAQLLGAVSFLRTPRQRRFARCSILRAAQWALDCKSHVPSAAEFRSRHHQLFFELFTGHQDYTERAVAAFGSHAAALAARQLLLKDSGTLRPKTLRFDPAPRLVLTSPPYLGVHVLYHRWQVLGRRETDAPYWIAGRRSEHSSIPFTFAHRRAKQTDKYFASLERCMRATHRVIGSHAFVVQLVAFADADAQLPTYLDVMRKTGFEKCEVEISQGEQHLVRQVPNRRWYALLGKQSKSSKEYLLIHRKSS